MPPSTAHNNAMAVETKDRAAGRLAIIHAAVPGRLRIKVDGLRHNRRLRMDLERRLAGADGIRSVTVHELTGNLLVLFDPSLPREAILRQVEAALERLPADDTPRTPVPWHRLTAEVVCRGLGSDPTRGLTVAEATNVLRHTGPNTLPKPTPRSRLELLGRQFASLPVALLGCSAVLALVTGGLADAVIIAGVVVLNAAIGYVTEAQAERTISGLVRGGQTTALVLRGGSALELKSEAVVPGDILDLSPGRFISADARLLDANALAVDESILTGESLPTAKTPAPLPAADLPIGDRSNMVFAGTRVSAGWGRAVVVATGPETEIGRIQALVGSTEPPETPLQRQLGQLSRQLVGLSLAVSALVFGLGWLRGTSSLVMLRSAVALAVAALPEGLPTIATTSLAIGLRRLRKEGVLIRHLVAVETLGSVEVVLFDKTGTLTRNRMSVATIVAGERRYQTDRGFAEAAASPAVRQMLEIAALCNDAQLNGEDSQGSSTELALLQAAGRAGIDLEDLRRSHPRIGVRLRSDRRLSMSTLHASGDGRLLAVKGNPSEVLAMCDRWERPDGSVVPLDDGARERLGRVNDDLAADGLRVLGIAQCQGSSVEIDESGDLPPRLVWLGMVGLADPLREDMPQVVSQLRSFGLDTVMVTGDQAATAQAIARQLGLGAPDARIAVVDSGDIDQASRAPQAVLGATAFARIAPADKLRVVRLHQKAGHVVAMVGDGVNDGPALKAADVGLTLAAEGTDVAKDLADAVLMGDDPRGLVAALRQGRGLRHSVRRSLHFLLATNLSEILVVLAATALGLGQPLNALQLLWINLVSDVLPGLALATEPASEDVIRTPAPSAAEPVLSRLDFGRLAEDAAFIGGGCLAAYVGGRQLGPKAASTMASHSLVVAQMLHAFTARSDRYGLFGPPHPTRNRPLDLAVGGTLAAQGLINFVPLARRVLGLAPLGPAQLLTATAAGIVPYLLIEARKRLRQPAIGGAAGPPPPVQPSGRPAPRPNALTAD